VVKADHLEDLVRLGTLTRPAVRFLEASVVAGLNILVAGGTQSGNATNAWDTRPESPVARRSVSASAG
jgi:Flp pilus assembly CpaF family ATPase